MKRLEFCAIVMALGLGAVSPAAQAQTRAASEDDEELRELKRTCGADVPPNTCNVREHLAGLEERLLRAPAPSSAAPRGQVWDHRSPPRYLAEVDARFHLTAAEKKLLFEQGFVVPARLEWRDYANALHEVHQSQLPLYVSADAILHAVFKENDLLIQRFELEIERTLTSIIRNMRDALPRARASWPGPVADDVDLYLTVAARLNGDDEAMPSRQHLEPQVRALVEAVSAAKPGLLQVPLFGRPRVVDFGAFKPRGHYVAREEYFRTLMWLTRIEFNLASRGCRSSAPEIDKAETPREQLDALALADLARRAKVLGEIDAVDRKLTALAGARQDVSLQQLEALRAEARIGTLGDKEAPARLRSAIGDRFRRTASTRPVPAGTEELPAIATLLGDRAPGERSLTRHFLNDAVPGRTKLGVAELAASFGHEGAKRHLVGDLAQFPQLGEQIEVARRELAGFRAGDDLYSRWFDAVRALGQRPTGTLPSFMATDAFADLRLNTIAAAYGQLRHNYVLLTADAYGDMGCEIPDGYVEPAVPTYDALIAYAERGAELTDDQDRAYFERLGRVLRILRGIAAEELANHPLTEEARRFLAMVVEVTPKVIETGYAPYCGAEHSGWYFQLFTQTESAFELASFIADYHTSGRPAETVYLGARGPRLGIFVIDSGGAPRLAVGPVARAFEYRSVGPRLTDQDSLKLKDSELSEPWASSYTVGATPPPSLELKCEPAKGGLRSCEVAAKEPLAAPVTLRRLDYHGKSMETVTHSVGGQPERFTFRKAIRYERPALQILSGGYQGEVALKGLWRTPVRAALK